MSSIATLLSHSQAAEIDDELLKSHSIYTSIADLGNRLWGFVYQCRHGHYHIVAADWLGPAERRRLFWHEAWHIIKDFPRLPYVIGLDEQWTVREKKADHAYQRIVHRR